MINTLEPKIFFIKDKGTRGWHTCFRYLFTII